MNKIHYENLKMVSLFIGNPFKGIKKFMIMLEDDHIEIKDNGSLKKLDYPLIYDQNEINILKQGLKDINIDSWLTEYPPLERTIDPDNWSLVLRFNDDTKMEYVGSNNFPSNFDMLLELFRKYSYIFDK